MAFISWESLLNPNYAQKRTHLTLLPRIFRHVQSTSSEYLIRYILNTDIFSVAKTFVGFTFYCIYRHTHINYIESPIDSKQENNLIETQYEIELTYATEISIKIEFVENERRDGTQ